MQIGTIVKSKAGKDKENFLIVLELQGKTAFVVDGKERPLERAKKKNILHLAPTKTIVGQENLSTNKKIKNVLKDYTAKLTEVI